jgi:hypothetical protein
MQVFNPNTVNYCSLQTDQLLAPTESNTDDNPNKRKHQSQGNSQPTHWVTLAVMMSIAFIVVMVLIATGVLFGGPEPPRTPLTIVFVLAGQSNMRAGRTLAGHESFPDGVLQYNQSNVLVPAGSILDHPDGQGVGPVSIGYQFTLDYLAAFPEDTVVLVPCAWGGTGFGSGETSWGGEGGLSDAVISRTNQLFTENPSFVLGGFLWHQGSTSRQMTTDAYKDALDAQFWKWRNDIDKADYTTPVVVGDLNEELILVYPNDNVDGVRSVIQTTPDRIAYSGFANSIGLPSSGDNVHFSPESLLVFGSRYFTQWQQAPANAPTNPGLPQNLHAGGDVDARLTWEEPQNTGKLPITAYHLTRSVNGAPYTLIYEGLPAPLVYVDSNVVSGLTYTYRVAAANAQRTGAYALFPEAVTITELSSLAEAESSAHWLFGVDNPTNTDMRNAISTTGSQPANFSDGFVRLREGDAGSGLDTGIAEGVAQTICVVFRRHSAASQVIAGTLGSTGNGMYVGCHFYSSCFSLLLRGTPVNVKTDDRYDFENQERKFAFAAYSLNHTTGDYLIFSGKDGSNDVQTGNAATTQSPRTIYIGNGYYGSFNGQIDVAEAIIFDFALTQQELADVYDRSQVRMAGRNISLF